MELTNSAALFPGFGRSARMLDTEADADAAGADFNNFLNLLTAQLKNQDPLEPLDSTQFVAQLASFSTVEQLIGTNTRLDGLAAQSTASAVTALTDWIGREVTAIDGSFRASGASQTFGIPFESGATGITASVRRADGRLLQELPLPSVTAPEAVWNGKDADGLIIAGEQVSIELTYRQNDTILAVRPAEVFQQVTGVRADAAGMAVLGLEGGGSVAADRVAGLRNG